MEQSISPAPVHTRNINVAGVTSPTLNESQDIPVIAQTELQEILPGTTSEMSGYEIQIISVKKRKKNSNLGSPIKVESGDEEVEEEEAGRCSEVKIKKRKDDDSKSIEVQAPTTKCNSPKDLTCSICLGEFDNKSFLDQCFHILFAI
jgi:hypothetical protein